MCFCFLPLRYSDREPHKNHTQRGSGIVDLSTFPSFVQLEIWVDEENKLGKVQSDHLEIDANKLGTYTSGMSP